MLGHRTTTDEASRTSGGGAQHLLGLGLVGGADGGLRGDPFMPWEFPLQLFLAAALHSRPLRNLGSLARSPGAGKSFPRRAAS
jgi:hypothetical protein